MFTQIIYSNNYRKQSVNGLAWFMAYSNICTIVLITTVYGPPRLEMDRVNSRNVAVTVLMSGMNKEVSHFLPSSFCSCCVGLSVALWCSSLFADSRLPLLFDLLSLENPNFLFDFLIGEFSLATFSGDANAGDPDAVSFSSITSTERVESLVEGAASGCCETAEAAASFAAARLLSPDPGPAVPAQCNGNEIKITQSESSEARFYFRGSRILFMTQFTLCVRWTCLIDFCYCCHRGMNLCRVAPSYC